MSRFLICLFFIVACSTGVVSTGGERRYAYDPGDSYRPHQLKLMSSDIIATSQRDPQFGKLSQLFGSTQNPLKRVGIIIFETRIQPTYEGLAKKNKVYLSEAGKQIMTENFLRIWEQSFGILASDVEFVPTTEIKKARAFQAYGRGEENFVKARRSILAPDDIFYLDAGKKTTTTTILNPRGMRDMSFLLVPANEMMGGPKWSEQNKHFVNDLCKELKLDAVIIALSDISWTASHTDKHSGEFIPEEAIFKLQASVLVPLSSYHERLEKLKDSSRPNLTVAYRKYDAKLKIPIRLSVSEEEQDFPTIERELLAPLMKSYTDLSQMMIFRISEDLKSTW
jgi:hypothetical protein